MKVLELQNNMDQTAGVQCFGLRKHQMPTRLYIEGRQRSKKLLVASQILPLRFQWLGLHGLAPGSNHSLFFFFTQSLWDIPRSQPSNGSLKHFLKSVSSLARDAVSTAPTLVV